MTNRDPGSGAAGALPGPAGAPSGTAGALFGSAGVVVDPVVGVDDPGRGADTASLEVGGEVGSEVGGDATGDDGDVTATEEGGDADVGAIRRPLRPAAPWVPPPNAVPTIATTTATATAMRAQARVVLLTLVTSAKGYRFDEAPSARWQWAPGTDALERRPGAPGAFRPAW